MQYNGKAAIESVSAKSMGFCRRSTETSDYTQLHVATRSSARQRPHSTLSLMTYTKAFRKKG